MAKGQQKKNKEAKKPKKKPTPSVLLSLSVIWPALRFL
jgi:hypothetical protein